MKLFLNSKGFPVSTQKAFIQLVGKPLNKISVLFVINAKDLYPPPPPDYRGTKEEITDVVGNLQTIDLRQFKGNLEELEKKIRVSDVLWIGGGNTFYLRYIMKETGFDSIIHRLVEDGVIYAGTSAGAIVAGPTLKYFDKMDDPSNPPEMVEEGLELVDFVTIPHWGNEKYTGVPREVRHELLTKTGFGTVPLTDDQALVINGSTRSVIG